MKTRPSACPCLTRNATTSSAGKTAEFKVHLHGLQKRELPALDDSLAQTVGDYETLDALKDEIRRELLSAAKRQTDDQYGNECIDALVKQATIEFAPQMIKPEVDELVERTKRRIKQQKMTMQDYLEALGKTEEQYREELQPTAEIRLKRGLALGEVHQARRSFGRRRRGGAANRSDGGRLRAAVQRSPQDAGAAQNRDE